MKYVLRGTICVLLAVNPLVLCARNDAAGTSEPRVHLREAVEVKRSQVWLADLLPADAPIAIEHAGAAIELCHAPQPGSPRVLGAAQITLKLAGLPEILRQLFIPSRIIVRYSGWPIAETTVRLAISRFLRQQGRQHDLPDAARLEWPRPLSATEEHPVLEVMGVDWDNRQQSLQVRLRCLKRVSCGTFLVHVFLPPPFGEEWRERLGAERDRNRSQGQAAPTATGAVLAERGKPATLILDDGGMRISIRVTCMQPGVLNQQIRVFDQQSRHVFQAEVVGAGLLHANL
jgi:hypothetical protein